MVNAIIALCAVLTGIVGTYFYMKDKTVIATSIGAKFDLYWKVFGFFLVLGGITSMIVLVFLKEFGVYIALGLGAIAIFFAMSGNKEVDAGARQKQYNLAGIFLFAALGVAFLTFMLGDNKKVEDKPPAVHHTTMTPREKPKPKTKEKEEVESHTAETKPQEQTVTNSGKEVYVGAYNDGTKVYILTDTIKRNAGNFTCTVKAGQDQLQYRFDGHNYSNSEGYHGNINDGKSPVALNIYNYCTNGKLADSNEITWVIKLKGENLYVKNGSVVRVGDAHPDVAPEFKCVIVDDSGQEMNFEFKARGIVVMFVEGQRFSDSSSEPNVEALYSAIIKKFLRP